MNNVKPRGFLVRFRPLILFSCAFFWCSSAGAFAEKSVPRRLYAGADSNYPPLSYVQNGLATGFDRAFLDRLGELLRLPVDIRLYQWSETLETIADGRSDFIAGCIQTESRDERFDFTIPYFIDQYYIFANKKASITDAGDLAGKRLAVLENDAVLDLWVRPAGLESDCIAAASLEEAFDRVNDGLADYTLAPYAMGAAMIDRKGLKNVAYTERPLFPAEFRFAVRKGDADLLAFLNEGIAIMQRSGETQRLIKKAKIPSPHESFEYVTSITPFFWIMASILLAFLIGLIWYFTAVYGFSRQSERSKEDVKFLELVLGSLPFGLRWESLDRTRSGENQLYRIYNDPERKKTVRRKPLEIATMLGDPVGKAILLEDSSRQQELESRVKKITRELAEKNAQLVEQSIVDPVSGLLNRGFIKSKILGLSENFRTRNEVFSVILVKWKQNDPDPFSVRSFARRLKSCIGIHDFAGIVEPGLFAVLFPGLTEAELPAMGERVESVMSEGGESRRVECALYPCESSDSRIVELLRML